jgi:hypothetical protein
MNMEQVRAERFTTKIDEPFVVFLIGARINRLRAVKQWLMVTTAFPRMLQELYQHPEKGFLAGEQFFRFYPLTTIMVSYWRSYDHLEQYARSRNDSHLPAWQRFNREIGNDGTVGVWHETYKVAPGSYEALYANMPLFGLSKATQQALPAVRGSARERMTGQVVNSTPIPELEGHSY